MTSQPASVTHCATASLANVPSRQHQTKLRPICAAWLAAASDYQPQDWSSLLPARAGFLSMTLTSLETWPGIRARSFPRRAGANRLRDHSLRVVACKRSRAHSVPAEQFLQCVAHRDHPTRPFAVRLPSMVQELSGRRLTNGQKRTSGAAKND